MNAKNTIFYYLTGEVWVFSGSRPISSYYRVVSMFSYYIHTSTIAARLADPSPICQLEPTIKYVSLFLFPSEFFFCPTHGWVNK